MKRRVLFVALAIALPLALVVPLRALRSWQPRELKLVPNSNAPASLNDLNAIFWSPQGLLLSHTFSDAWSEARQLTNWNGQTVTVRVVRAANASLDASGQWAALIYAPNEAEKADIWNVPQQNSRHDAGKRIDAARWQPRLQYGLSVLVISPDGKTVAFNKLKPKKAGVVGIADARSGQIITGITHRKKSMPTQNEAAIKTQYFEVSALAYTPDSRQLALAGASRVRIVDAQNGSVIGSWSKHFSIPTSAQWSPDARYLALGRGDSSRWGFRSKTTASAEPFLWIHDVQTGKVVRSWSQKPNVASIEGGVTSLSWAPDSKSLAWGTSYGQTLLMNLSSGAINKRFSIISSGTVNPAQFVTFSPDGQTLAVASPNKITLWRVK